MEVVLLKCDLAKTGDAKNQLLLYPAKLVIHFKGQRTEYDYDQVKAITISNKKLIIALVLGGIGTTFSMLALSLGWYHYQLNLFLVFLFFGLMYYGFVGKDAITITERGHQSLFLISANTAVVGEFISFLKERIWKLNSPVEEEIYHLAASSDWESQAASYHFQNDSLKTEGFIHCSTKEQLVPTFEKFYQGRKGLLLISLNPKWVIEEVKWEYSETRKSDFPHIYGAINKSAILSIRECRDVEDLQKMI